MQDINMRGADLPQVGQVAKEPKVQSPVDEGLGEISASVDETSKLIERLNIKLQLVLLPGNEQTSEAIGGPSPERSALALGLAELARMSNKNNAAILNILDRLEL